MWIRIVCWLDSQLRARFCKNDRATVSVVRTIGQLIPVYSHSWKKKKHEGFSTLSGNCLFLGPMNLFRDASHCWLLPCVSATGEYCIHQFQKLQQLCDFLSPLHTEQLRVLTTKVRAGFRWDCACFLRKAHFTLLVWITGPRRIIRF
jgi:hypothetical protein